MNIFKSAYKSYRENSDVIFRGFGFKHLSDATSFYVHPNNQSPSHSTTLCQPIGEAVMYFAEIMKQMINNTDQDDKQSDFWISEDEKSFFLHFYVPDDWSNANPNQSVIPTGIDAFRVYLLGSNIVVNTLDQHGNTKLIQTIDELETIQKHGLFFPLFSILLAREFYTNENFQQVFLQFLDRPAADLFVNVHEDFYQNNKFTDFDLDADYVAPSLAQNMRSFRENYATIQQNKLVRQNEASAKQSRPISRFSPADFEADMLDQIPCLSAEFILPTELRAVCNAVQSGDARALLLHGPSGTGKTMACKLICQETQLPIYETINCTENLDEFVLGKYLPDGDRIIFKESYVTRAIRMGGAVVFEEINFAKPQYLAFLNSLLDENGFVRLDNGERVERHPNFRFFATMNIGYFGTKQLNQALYNRFQVVAALDELSDEAIKRMLLARVPECEPNLSNLLSVYHKLRIKIEQEELDTVVSPRNLENWAKLARYESYLDAAEHSIIQVAKNDKLLEKAIRDVLLLYIWK